MYIILNGFKKAFTTKGLLFATHIITKDLKTLDLK